MFNHISNKEDELDSMLGFGTSVSTRHLGTQGMGRDVNLFPMSSSGGNSETVSLSFVPSNNSKRKDKNNRGPAVINRDKKACPYNLETISQTRKMRHQTSLSIKDCSSALVNNINPCNHSQKEEKNSTARVVRLRRKGGKIVQDCDVYIGRACNMGGWHLPESKWHNPFTIKATGSAAAAVAHFERYILTKPELMAALPDLKGKVLGCWCKTVSSAPCHGDVLARLANALPVDSSKAFGHS